MYKYIIRFLIGIFLIFPISCSVLEIKEVPSLKAPATPKPGECTACHEGKEVLPQGHVETKDMMGKECDACHRPEEASLRTKIPLGHMHMLEGISCKGCHEDPASAEAIDPTVCKKCHDDLNLLMDRTNDLAVNPHFSPHEGKVPECVRCHHLHKGSENYCGQCHGLEYKVP